MCVCLLYICIHLHLLYTATQICVYYSWLQLHVYVYRYVYIKAGHKCLQIPVLRVGKVAGILPKIQDMKGAYLCQMYACGCFG